MACLRISPALAQAVKRPSSGRLVSMKRARHANATELAGQPQISLHDTYTWDVSTQLAQKKYAKGDFIKSAEFTKLDVPGMQLHFYPKGHNEAKEGRSNTPLMVTAIAADPRCRWLPLAEIEKMQVAVLEQHTQTAEKRVWCPPCRLHGTESGSTSIGDNEFSAQLMPQVFSCNHTQTD